MEKSSFSKTKLPEQFRKWEARNGWIAPNNLRITDEWGVEIYEKYKVYKDHPTTSINYYFLTVDEMDNITVWLPPGTKLAKKSGSSYSPRVEVAEVKALRKAREIPFSESGEIKP